MATTHDGNGPGKRRLVSHRKGVTYFSKKTERTFFFALTIGMLLWGLITKFEFL
ncbi:MAG: hypothetical protein ACOWYE_16090 [Desulfatiglandales bacterium]